MFGRLTANRVTGMRITVSTSNRPLVILQPAMKPAPGNTAPRAAALVFCDSSNKF